MVALSGYMGIAVDVTDRKLVEETLRESEARFLELAEQSRTTHWEVDPRGSVHLCQRCVRGHLGLSSGRNYGPDALLRPPS